LFVVVELDVMRTADDYVKSEKGRATISQYVGRIYERGGGGNRRVENLSEAHEAVMDFQEGLLEFNGLLEGLKTNRVVLKDCSLEAMEAMFTKLVTTTNIVGYENVLLLQLWNVQRRLEALSTTVRKSYYSALNKCKQEHEEMIQNVQTCGEDN